MFLAATLALLVTLSLALVRALLGPSLYDRILAINSIGTKTVLLIALYGFLTGRPDFTDLALLYALLNTLGTVAVLAFIQRQFPAQQRQDGEQTLSQEQP